MESSLGWNPAFEAERGEEAFWSGLCFTDSRQVACILSLRENIALLIVPEVVVFFVLFLFF